MKTRVEDLVIIILQVVCSTLALHPMASLVSFEVVTYYYYYYYYYNHAALLDYTIIKLVGYCALQVSCLEGIGNMHQTICHYINMYHSELST